MDNDSRKFRVVLTHRVKIIGNKTELFNESNKNDSTITDLDEHEIVELLFNDSYILNSIVEEICDLPVKDIIHKLQVRSPLLTKVEEQEIIGDIDAVLIPKENPEQTVIIEFKKIKVSTLQDKFVKINKIDKCRKKSFSQIKKLRKFNYFKTYLGIIIEDDARNVESANTLIRHSKAEALKLK